jgi:hypothetical protein
VGSKLVLVEEMRLKRARVRRRLIEVSTQVSKARDISLESPFNGLSNDVQVDEWDEIGDEMRWDREEEKEMLFMCRARQAAPKEMIKDTYVVRVTCEQDDGK